MNTQWVYVPGTNWIFELSWQHLTGDIATQYGENKVGDKIALNVSCCF